MPFLVLAEDNSYSIVEEHEIICDLESIKVMDEVRITGRNRDTGRNQIYDATVLMIHDDPDELAEAQNQRIQADKEAARNKDHAKKRDSQDTTSEDEELIKDLLGRGKRSHKPKRYDGFTGPRTSSKTGEKSHGKKPKSSENSSKGSEGGSKSALGKNKRKSSCTETPEEVVASTSLGNKVTSKKESASKSSHLKKLKSSRDDRNASDLSCLKPMSTTPLKITESSTGSPTKEELRAMLALSQRRLSMLEGSQNRTSQIFGRHESDANEDLQQSDEKKDTTSNGIQRKKSDGKENKKSDGKDNKKSDGKDNKKSDGKDNKKSDGKGDEKPDGEENKKSGAEEGKKSDGKQDKKLDEKKSGGNKHKKSDGEEYSKESDGDQDPLWLSDEEWLRGDEDNEEKQLGRSEDEHVDGAGGEIPDGSEGTRSDDVPKKKKCLLRHPTAGQDLTDIGKGTYVLSATVRSLFHLKSESQVARVLLVGVFSNYALTHCSFEGNAPKGVGRDFLVGVEARPALPATQREAVLDFAFKLARHPDHEAMKKNSAPEVKRSLGSKLSELRRRYEKKKELEAEVKAKKAAKAAKKAAKAARKAAEAADGAGAADGGASAADGRAGAADGRADAADGRADAAGTMMTARPDMSPTGEVRMEADQ